MALLHIDFFMYKKCLVFHKKLKGMVVCLFRYAWIVGKLLQVATIFSSLLEYVFGKPLPPRI